MAAQSICLGVVAWQPLVRRLSSIGGSIVTDRRICILAQQLEIKRIFAVANKIREPGELRAIEENLEFSVIGALPYSEALRVAGPTASNNREIRHQVHTILESVQQPSVI
jgi:CO dehydrogenase nickel-insertion accessory protein CooC1